MAKSKDWSTKLEKTSSPSQTRNWVQKIAKALNVPRDSVGSIVCKFKFKVTVITLPKTGQKKEAINNCNQISENASLRKTLE